MLDAVDEIQRVLPGHVLRDRVRVHEVLPFLRGLIRDVLHREELLDVLRVQDARPLGELVLELRVRFRERDEEAHLRAIHGLRAFGRVDVHGVFDLDVDAAWGGS